VLRNTVPPGTRGFWSGTLPFTWQQWFNDNVLETWPDNNGSMTMYKIVCPLFVYECQVSVKSKISELFSMVSFHWINKWTLPLNTKLSLHSFLWEFWLCQWMDLSLGDRNKGNHKEIPVGKWVCNYIWKPQNLSRGFLKVFHVTQLPHTIYVT